jgi:transcription termination/antitermination protein NusA
VESQMAALVAPGAPVSVLIDYGLAEAIVEKLIQAGVGTIDQLGAMTPEQLEEIQDIGANAVERIQESVNAYYGQFEEQPQGSEIPEQTMPEPEPLAADMHATAEEAAEVQGTDAESLEPEPGPEAPEDGIEAAQSPLYDPDSSEERFEPGSVEAESSDGSGTIEKAGSPHNQSEEGAGSREHPEE